jgi:hypothetical protein
MEKDYVMERKSKTKYKVFKIQMHKFIMIDVMTWNMQAFVLFHVHSKAYLETVHERLGLLASTYSSVGSLLIKKVGKKEKGR